MLCLAPFGSPASRWLCTSSATFGALTAWSALRDCQIRCPSILLCCLERVPLFLILAWGSTKDQVDWDIHVDVRKWVGLHSPTVAPQTSFPASLGSTAREFQRKMLAVILILLHIPLHPRRYLSNNCLMIGDVIPGAHQTNPSTAQSENHTGKISSSPLSASAKSIYLDTILND